MFHPRLKSTVETAYSVVLANEKEKQQRRQQGPEQKQEDEEDSRQGKRLCAQTEVRTIVVDRFLGDVACFMREPSGHMPASQVWHEIFRSL